MPRPTQTQSEKGKYYTITRPFMSEILDFANSRVQSKLVTVIFRSGDYMPLYEAIFERVPVE